MLADALADPMIADASVHTHGLRLAAAAVRWTDGDLLSGLRDLAAAVRRPAVAWRLADWVGAELDREPWRTLRPDLSGAAAGLADDADPTAALLAAALVRVGGGWAGWPSPWRHLLDRLRHHPDPDVRDHALDTVTDPE